MFVMWRIQQSLHRLVIFFKNRIDRSLRNAGAFHFALGFAHFRSHFQLSFDQRLDCPMTGFDRSDHRLVADFIRPGFYHQNGICRAGNSEIQIRIFHLLKSRVNHIFAVDQSDTDGTDRSVPWDIRDSQRCRSGIDRQNIQLIFKIGGEAIEDNLNFVSNIL